MKILGIDPGTGRLGYAIARQHGTRSVCCAIGCLTTPPRTPQGTRLLSLQSELAEIIRLHRPDGAVVEKLYFSKNVRTAMDIAEARGMILLTLASEKIPIIELSPQHVKLGVTGNGAAPKNQVQQMVQVLFSLDAPPKPDDAADALALAFAGLPYFADNKRE